MQSRFEDRIKDMFPSSPNFNREVEVNQNNEKELTLTFDLKDYKVMKYEVIWKSNMIELEVILKFYHMHIIVICQIFLS